MSQRTEQPAALEVLNELAAQAKSQEDLAYIQSEREAFEAERAAFLAGRTAVGGNLAEDPSTHTVVPASEATTDHQIHAGAHSAN